MTCPLCVQQLSQTPQFVPGVWGPCLSAMVPELWLNEGGQSATGRLVRLPIWWTSALTVYSLYLRNISMCAFPLFIFKKYPEVSIILQRGQNKDLLYCVKEMELVPELSPCLSSDARNNAADSHHKPRQMINVEHYTEGNSLSVWCCLCFRIFIATVHFLFF